MFVSVAGVGDDVAEEKLDEAAILLAQKMTMSTQKIGKQTYDKCFLGEL